MFELVMDDGDSSVSSSGRQMRVGGPDVGSYLRSVTSAISSQVVASIEEHEYEMLRRIGDRLRERWIEKASQRLNTTFESYIAGLSDPIIVGNTVTIRLADYGEGDGEVPMMIEEGRGPYALNAKITENKLIGFAHGDPRGGTPGTPLGDPYKGHWKFRTSKSFAALQDKLIDQVRRLRSGERLKAGLVQSLAGADPLSYAARESTISDR